MGARRILFGVLLALGAYALFCGAAGEDEAQQLYGALERRLQSLRALEIRYYAEDPANARTVAGRMVWVKPGRFYHDTPEWTLCESDGEQWRLLKAQGTLIRELAPEGSAWTAQGMLLQYQREFRPVRLETISDRRRILYLTAADGAEATLTFPEGSIIPDAVAAVSVEGGEVRYRIVRWDENVVPDDSLFVPPDVAPENVIDFRFAGKKARR